MGYGPWSRKIVRHNLVMKQQEALDKTQNLDS